MGILVVIVALALSSWSIFALFRRLRHQHASSGSWVAFGVLLACGLALGAWCAFYCEYHMGTRYRIGSFPIPVVFFHLEQGDWVDFPVSDFQAWASAFANIVTIAALATIPMWLLLSRLRRFHSARNRP